MWLRWYVRPCLSTAAEKSGGRVESLGVSCDWILGVCISSDILKSTATRRRRAQVKTVIYVKKASGPAYMNCVER